MQKIIEQELQGSEDAAKKAAKYTWEKGEIAWYFCTSFRDIFKVEFTGERWISGNKWRYNKIYQYKYLEGSGDHEKCDNSDVSHDEESEFYTTKKEALDRGFAFIENVKKDALETFNSDLIRLDDFDKKEDKISQFKNRKQ